MSLTPRFPVDAAPVPVSAVYDSNVVIVVTFNRPIQNQPTAVLNWFVEGYAVNPIGTAIVLPSSIQLTLPNGLDPPFDLEYFASPPDVEGTNGLDVEPFVIPVT